MKISTVFLKAAKYLAKVPLDQRSIGCCSAIERGSIIDPGAGLKASRYFHKLFVPNVAYRACWYFNYETGGVYEGPYLSDKEARERRLTALLLAAEIAESEGK